MKQAIKLINTIIADYNAILKTNSIYLKNDRKKAINRNKRDLKEYCSYKGLNYKKICEEYKI